MRKLVTKRIIDSISPIENADGYGGLVFERSSVHKTELVMTGILGDWDTLIKMRSDKAAHPQMQYLMKLLKEEKEKTMETLNRQHVKSVKHEMWESEELEEKLSDLQSNL